MAGGGALSSFPWQPWQGLPKIVEPAPSLPRTWTIGVVAAGCGTNPDELKSPMARPQMTPEYLIIFVFSYPHDSSSIGIFTVDGFIGFSFLLCPMQRYLAASCSFALGVASASRSPRMNWMPARKYSAKAGVV